MQLYEKIKKYRKDNNMTQADLAEKLDISRQAVQKWESGITTPDVMKLPELAKIFGVTVDSLLSNDIIIPDLNKESVEVNKVNLETPTKEHSTRTRSMLDYLLMLPIGTAILTGLIMFFLIGGIIVGLSFILTLALPISAVTSLVLIFINISNGIGAILICISGVFIGLGAAYPMYIASRFMLVKYKQYSKIIIKKVKNFRVRSLL